MYDILSGMILYRPDRNSIISSFADSAESIKNKRYDLRRIRDDLAKSCGDLISLAVKYGFRNDLWHDLLTFLLITDENPYSLAAEQNKCPDGSLYDIALKDFERFITLFAYDFSDMENAIGSGYFDLIRNFKAPEGVDDTPLGKTGSLISSLADRLSGASSPEEFASVLNSFYVEEGVGIFALYKAFRYNSDRSSGTFEPIVSPDPVRLSDLIGYERQKSILTGNTLAFIEGRPANNVLLYGDSGTGKSSSVKALINEYGNRGLKLIEVMKDNYSDLRHIISEAGKRNYRFIIFLDDLSFEESETDYKYLKAIIEGGVESRPDNVLIYATSNRRHIIRETWTDRNDMEYGNDIHRSDTMEEKLSLSSRFGVTINYEIPGKKDYDEIIKELAARHISGDIDEEELLLLASRWELRHGGLSGRTAKQFIDDLAGKTDI